MTTHIEHISPSLYASNIDRSLEYFTTALGFKPASWVQPGAKFACVTRDDSSIYLCERSQGQPGTWVWIGVDDVEALLAEFRSSGAQVIRGPLNFPCAMEIHMETPDGHMLRFGSDSKNDRAFDAFPAL